jgi:hypothetical protein
MIKQIIFGVCVLSFCIVTALSANAGELRLPLGLSYVSSLNKVTDLRAGNLEAKGYTNVERFNWPVGFTFQPYYELDSGLGVGMGLGPAIFSSQGKYSFTNVPIGMDLRYIFLHSSRNSPYIENTSPYIRVGARYNLASGDFVKDSSPGAFGAIGIEFSRKRTLSLGLELAYDASEIKFEKFTKHYLDPSGKYWDYEVGSVKIKPYSVMLSFFIDFSGSL